MHAKRLEVGRIITKVITGASLLHSVLTNDCEVDPCIPSW